MYSPRGRVVTTARLRAADGGATVTVSAPAVLVTVHTTAESRRSLRRAADRAGVVLEPVEGDAYAEADSTFNRRTGVRERAESVEPATFRAVGPVDGLRAVCHAPCVRTWEFVVHVRVPVGGGGTGTPTASAERNIRGARREAITRAEDANLAERRPFVPADPQSETVRQLAPGADADTSALVAELVRLAARAGDLTPAEHGRVTRLRSLLGV